MRRGAIRLVAVMTVAGLGIGGLAIVAGPASAAPTGFAQIVTLSNVDGMPSSCQLARVDVGAAGTVTPIGPVFDIATAGCPIDMALHDGQLYGVLTFGDESTPSQLVTLDPTTGVRTLVGSLGFATNLAGLAFDKDENLWFYAQNADPACSGGMGQACLYRLDPTTAAATLVAAAATDVQVIGATATCTAVLANEFIQSDESVTGQLVTVNTQTAALTPRPNPYGTGILMTGLEHDPNGPLRGLGFTLTETGPDSPAAYTIDADTGLPTKIADFTLANGQVLAALALAELECTPAAPVPAAPAPAAPVPATPRFTG